MEKAAEAPRRLPAGIVTFVMTDIESSTRIFREMGDDYVGLLATHNALLRGAFTAHRGAEINTEGDALVLAFDDAGEAVRGCVAGQLALEACHLLGEPLR